MTHKDIYTKFMIEYDKANVTSSYPSLTEYEVATVLDKAYNALIAQKVTGNNYRRMPFEADVKAISDLQPLVVKQEYGLEHHVATGIQEVPNLFDFHNPSDFLYSVGCYLVGSVSEVYNEESIVAKKLTGNIYDGDNEIHTTCFLFDNLYKYNLSGGSFLVINSGTASPNPIYWKAGLLLTIDNRKKVTRMLGPFTTEAAYNYMLSLATSNDPFILIPLRDLNVNNVIDSSNYDVVINTVSHTDYNVPYDKRTRRTLPCQLVDFKTAERFFVSAYNMPWIKNPIYFIHNDTFSIVYDILGKYVPKKCILKYIKKPRSFVKDLPSNPMEDVSFFTGENGELLFELNNTMAEELISLAIAYALENIESPRLNSKLNMRGLEA